MQNSWSYIPVWVYILFVYLVIQGIRQCFARSVHVWRLFLIPLIFFVMSLNHLDGSPRITLLSGLCWIAAIILGGYIGYLHKRNVQLTIDKKLHRVSIPGDWTMLVLIMSIFLVEFVINAVEATGTAPYWWFAPTALGVSGFITGMAFGRSGTYLYRYFYSNENP